MKSSTEKIFQELSEFTIAGIEYCVECFYMSNNKADIHIGVFFADATPDYARRWAYILAETILQDLYPGSGMGVSGRGVETAVPYDQAHPVHKALAEADAERSAQIIQKRIERGEMHRLCLWS